MEGILDDIRTELGRIADEAEEANKLKRLELCGVADLLSENPKHPHRHLYEKNLADTFANLEKIYERM